MKKIVSLILTVVCFFGLMLELTGSDSNKKWGFRSYFEYVGENIEPFPHVNISFSYSGSDDILEKIWNVITMFCDILVYPFRMISTVIHNVRVIFDGFFPIRWGDTSLPGGSIAPDNSDSSSHFDWGYAGGGLWGNDPNQ